MAALTFKRYSTAKKTSQHPLQLTFLSKTNFYKYLLYGLIVITIVFSNTYAQVVDSLPSVLSIAKHNVGTIQSGNLVEGYYVLYESVKPDKHSNEYRMIAYDSNLNRVGKITLLLPEKEVLLEALAVNDRFIFLSTNDKNKTVTTSIYNWQGGLQKTYNTKLDVMSQHYLHNNFHAINPNRQKNKYLIPFGNQQFLTLIPIKNGQKFTFELTIFSADKEPLTYSPDDENIKLNQADYIGSTDSLLLFNLITKKQLIDNKYDPWLLGIDKRTATKSFMISNTINDFHCYLTSAIQEPATGEITMLGNYFKKGKILKSSTLGVCTIRANSAGQITNTGIFSWDKEIGKYLDVVDTGGVSDFGNLYIHDIVSTANGNSFIIAEGYKKTFNDAAATYNGLAFLARLATSTITGLTIPLGDRDAFDFTLTDLAIMEIDSSYSLKNIEPFFKEEHRTATTNNTDVKINRVGTGRHLTGAFDYDFVKSNRDHHSFEIGYKRYEQTETKELCNYYIIQHQNGKNRICRLELNSTAEGLWGVAAKDGFVLIAEYFLAEQNFKLRLVEIK